MFIGDALKLDSNSVLTIGSIPVSELAQKYGTPLYVLDESVFEANCKAYIDTLSEFYPGEGSIQYASKALSCVAVIAMAKRFGMGLDVCSGGELHTALLAGMEPKKIHFHGYNKTDDEIIMGIRTGIGCFVVDNLEELKRIHALSDTGKPVDVHLRLKPGVEAHTHNYMKTGAYDSKFGFAMNTPEAREAVNFILQTKSLNLVGINCHIGSQIFDPEPFCDAAEIMLDFLASLYKETGVFIPSLTLGGGFGIRYIEEQDPKPLPEMLKKIFVTITQKAQELGIELPRLQFEPGRSIVGPAGITIYQVGSVKEILGGRTYVAVDGGLSDNPRYSLYQAPYTAVSVSHPTAPHDKKVTIAGHACETDLLGEDFHLPQMEGGDLIAMIATGAYNYSMANNYNRYPRPAMVGVSGGESHVLVRRESYEDLTRLDEPAK